MPDCLFCKIGKKEIPSEIIYEDTSVTAFLDINPCTPGHTVVIPKAHCETIIELKDSDVTSLFSTVKKVVTLLNDKLGAKGFIPSPNGQHLVRGFTIGINHGRLAGQAIDHLHVHIIPRYEDDHGGSLHSVVHYQTADTVKEIAAKLKTIIH